MKTAADAKVAAANLYNASRELAMPAKQHELMGSSHDVLQTFITEQEAAVTHKDSEIASLKNVIRELEKMQQGGKP
jgi:hypothetical protein